MAQNRTSNMSNITKNRTVREHRTVRSKTTKNGQYFFRTFLLQKWFDVQCCFSANNNNEKVNNLVGTRLRVVKTLQKIIPTFTNWNVNSHYYTSKHQKAYSVSVNSNVIKTIESWRFKTLFEFTYLHLAFYSACLFQGIF